MKIVICFDINKLKNINLNREDFVLYNGDIDDSNFNHVNICNIDISYTSFKIEYEKEITNLLFLSGLTEDAKSLIESISPNIYMHNLRYCVFWIQSFKNILKSPCEEIIFTDYVKDINYFPFYEAEGEVNSKFLYNNHDFIAAQLMSCAKKFIDKNKSTKITILKQHSVFNLKFRIFVRRYFLFFVKIIFHFFKIILTKNKKSPIKKTSLIVSTRSLGHSFGLGTLLNRIDCVIHVSDGLSFSNKNKNFIIKRYDNVSTQYQTLSFKDLFYAVRKCYLLHQQKNKINSLDVFGVKLHLSSIFVEASISHLETELYTSSVFNLWKNINKPSLIFNSELISQYSLWLKNKFLNYNVRTIQLQTVAIDNIPCPNFIFSDLFLFDSNKILNYFRNIFPEKSIKMNFWGNLNLEKKIVIKKDCLKNIIYFTQPYEFEAQNQILLFLINYSITNNINFFVKPHPREKFENIPDYILKKLNILSSNITENEYFEICDLAILRTSSLTQDLILKGIPVVNYINSSYDKSVLNLFLNHNEVNVCSDFDELQDVFNSFGDYLIDYYRFRENYLHNVGINYGVDDFVIKLNNYMGSI